MHSVSASITWQIITDLNKVSLGVNMKIKIGCHEYEVEYKDAVLIKGEEVFGKINMSTDTITICSELSESRKFSTLIHEVTHGILEEIGNPFVKLMDEEHFVKPFANILSQVLIDNNLKGEWC